MYADAVFAARSIKLAHREAVGRRDRLPARLLEAIRAGEAMTRHCTKIHLRLAIDYSAREAILRATQSCGGSAVTRERPALKAGWSVTVQLEVLVAEYITPDALSDVLTNAGRLVGVGDFRPTFGRFRIERFARLALSDAAQ